MSQKPTQAQWAGTWQEKQLPQIACPGSPGRCGPGACLGWNGIWDTRVIGNALWGAFGGCSPVSLEGRDKESGHVDPWVDSPDVSITKVFLQAFLCL